MNTYSYTHMHKITIMTIKVLILTICYVSGLDSFVFKLSKSMLSAPSNIRSLRWLYLNNELGRTVEPAEVTVSS